METKNDVLEGVAQDKHSPNGDRQPIASQTANELTESDTDLKPVITETVTTQTIPSQTPSTSSPATPAALIVNEPSKDLQNSSIKSETTVPSLDNPINHQVSLLASTKADVAISLAKSPPERPIKEIIEVSESEQIMLDQKLKLWSNNVDDLPELNQPITWQEQGQTFKAHFNRKPARGDMDLDEIIVEITTQKDGERLSTKLKMKKLAFSNFGQFVHRWDKEVSMHDDEMSGRFHSNSNFSLQHTRKAKPIFTDKVTTASTRINLSGPASRKKVFLGGLETGVKRIDMPKPALLFAQHDTQPEERENTILIETSSRLTFLAEGAVLIEPIKGDDLPNKVTLADSPMYFFSSPKARLYVSGVVNGTVAVYSPNQITIEGNIRYSSFAPLKDGGDFLGLISGRNVVIASRRVIGKGDLTIHGAIYAKKRFVVTQIEGRHAGLLTVHGSVSVGSLSATEPRYATKIIFDRRLENIRPPGFPVTNRYELVATKVGWTREDSSFDNNNSLLLNRVQPLEEPSVLID